MDLTFSSAYQVKMETVDKSVNSFLRSKIPPIPTMEGGMEFACPITDRSFDEIAAAHSLAAVGLAGLLGGKDKILDIGTGMSRLREVVEPASKLYSIDLVHPDDLKLEKQSRWVQAYGDFLPFRDESFDILIATNSLPLWNVSQEQCERFYSESRRVLAVSGLAIIGEMTSFDKFLAKYVMNKPGDDFEATKTSIIYKKSEAFNEAEKDSYNLTLDKS